MPTSCNTREINSLSWGFLHKLEAALRVLFWRTSSLNFRRGCSYVLQTWHSRGQGGWFDGRMRWVPANNSSAFQRLSRLLPLHWYARNASCQQMLLTHDDTLGIRMDATSNFNLGTKRHYSGVNPVSLVRNSFVYRNHAELFYPPSSTQYSLCLPHCRLVLELINWPRP